MTYPDVSIWFVFQPHIQEIFAQLPTVITLEKFDQHRNNFLKFQEVCQDPKKDAILGFCQENKIDPFICVAKNTNSNRIAVISKNQDVNLQVVQDKLARPICFNPQLDDVVAGFDAILGCESPELLMLASKGLKVYLYKPSLGCISFQKMFPDTELFEATNNR